MLLASETLKIVIAVICIGFLVYFLVNLYFTNSGNKKVVEATASVEKLTGVISIVNQNGIEQEDHIQNPDGWRLMGFAGEETKPNSCAGKNCICICKNIRMDDILIVVDRQAKTCNEKGACGIVENLKGFNKIKIGDETFVIIRKLNGLIEVSKK